MRLCEDIPLEISHKAHRAHKLKLVTSDGPPFRCDGCMEPGSGDGRRYRCDDCEFDLHTSCALPQSTLKQKHLLYGDLEFDFLLQAPPSADEKFCSACGSATLGFVFHCSVKDLNLHPCCAALKMETVLRDGYILKLCKEAKHDCVFCGEKGRPPGASSNKKSWFRKEKLWAYRWSYGSNEGYLHVACMKKIAVQSWEETYQDSPGGGVVEASVPVMKGILQLRPSGNSEGSSATATGISVIETGSTIAQVITQATSSQ